jgi:hypothetical protein
MSAVVMTSRFSERVFCNKRESAIISSIKISSLCFVECNSPVTGFFKLLESQKDE